MSLQILTKEDLHQFKTDLFAELKNILSGHSNQPRKWLKSYEVREMLNISPGTLQNMRVQGTITFTKIGGLTFYAYEDILKLMESNRKEARR
jgi:hypothetical protein